MLSSVATADAVVMKTSLRVAAADQLGKMQ
jgi:hypothetical protein